MPCRRDACKVLTHLFYSSKRNKLPEIKFISIRDSLRDTILLSVPETQFIRINLSLAAATQQAISCVAERGVFTSASDKATRAMLWWLSSAWMQESL